MVLAGDHGAAESQGRDDEQHCRRRVEQPPDEGHPQGELRSRHALVPWLFRAKPKGPLNGGPLVIQ
jgi:hypothetical protein